VTLALPKARVYGGGVSTAPVPIGALTVDRQIFRMDGQPWQWLGCSAFPLCHLFEQGRLSEVDAFIDAYPGVRVLRVWDYVGPGWGADAWNASPADVWIAFLAYVRQRGLFVSRTALTDDDPKRIEPAKRTIEAITAAGCDNVMHEAGNEPNTHKEIQTQELIGVMKASGRLWSTGDYENSQYWRGTHGLYHPARTNDFARRAHDAYEYFHGGGPNSPSEPACPVPWVNDEPAKLQDVPRDPAAWRSHVAASLLFGSGFTMHSDTGKFCRLPTADEQALWVIAVEVLWQITPDAALGAYRRIPAEKEPGQTPEGRTYVVGNYMVRCQQKNTGAPEPGWTALDDVSVLFKKG
jgi:hypothetical protein